MRVVSNLYKGTILTISYHSLPRASTERVIPVLCVDRPECLKMLLTVIFLFAIVTVQAMKPDDVSSFFLKAPKSVPRAGRSAPGSYEGFFLKASKSVPRVGRRGGNDRYSPDDYQFVTKSFDQDESVNENEIPDFDVYDYGSGYLTNQYSDGKIPHRSRRYELVPHALLESEDHYGNQNKNTYKSNDKIKMNNEYY